MKKAGGILPHTWAGPKGACAFRIFVMRTAWNRRSRVGCFSKLGANANAVSRDRLAR